MNRREFMRRLENLLWDIPEQERSEALQYYNDYFEDAGTENEAKVIISLISPERVAENIKNDLNQNRTWNGYEEEKVEKGHEVIEYSYQQENEEYMEPVPEKKGMSTGLIVLLVVLGILALPVSLVLLTAAIGVLAGLFGLSVGISAVFLALVVGVGATAIALFFSALACIVVGFFCMPFNIWIGLAIVGGGFIIVSAGIFLILLTILVAKLAGFVVNGICKGIGKLFRFIFKKEKKASRA